LERQGEVYENLGAHILTCSSCVAQSLPSEHCDACGGQGWLPSTPYASLEDELAQAWWQPLLLATHLLVAGMRSEGGLESRRADLFGPAASMQNIHPWRFAAAGFVVQHVHINEHAYRCEQAKEHQTKHKD
jgi:hypothetical protein